MAIEDYFKGSSKAYGQLAGSLLASNRKEDKKQAKKALLASVVMNTFGALQNRQKQSIIDGANDVKEQYADIFNQNKSEFEAYTDEREELKRYNKNKEVFLNEEVTKIINNTDAAKAAGVTWENKNNEPEEVRKALENSYNVERKNLINRMETLKLDPRATTKTFEKFNQRAMNEYKAALSLVEDDPTKKGIIREAFNKIFGTAKDGTKRFGMAERAELEEALNTAKTERTTFRETMDRELIEKQLYEPLVFKNKSIKKSEIYSKVGNALYNTMQGIDKYKGVDKTFVFNIIDRVMKEEEGLSIQEIQERGLMQIIENKIDPSSYLTRKGAIEVNNRLLIDAYEDLKTQEEKRDFIEKQPEKLYMLADAYRNSNKIVMAQSLLDEYKDIHAEYKSYEPSVTEITNRVGVIEARIMNDPLADKTQLENRTWLGLLGQRVAQAENYFKTNNPSWSESYTEAEITEAAIDFIYNRVENEDSTNVRMSKAHLLPYSIKPNVDNLNEIVKDLPDMIEGIKNTYKKDSVQKEELQTLRNGLINYIDNEKLLELEDDEKLEFKNKINENFKSVNLASYEDTVVLSKNITDELGQAGLIDYHIGRRNLHLTEGTFKNAVNSIDLSTLSNEELKYLYPKKGYFDFNADPTVVKSILGINPNVNLTEKGSETSSLTTKIRKILNERLPEINRKDKDKVNEFLKDDNVEAIKPNQKFINSFKVALMESTDKKGPNQNYIYYLKRFNN